jgi:hypothetical protein
VEVYGMTEAPMGCEQRLDNRKIGSAGRESMTYEMRIVDENDEPVPPNTPGEIVLRPKVAGAIFSGYYRREADTVEAWRNLWFHTGDRGTRDEDGFLFFLDRMKDCIRRRGENISTWEVESAVNTHEAVLESAAYGVASELSESEVMIAVVLRSASLEPVELLDYCHGRMAHSIPRCALRRRAAEERLERVEKFKLREEAVTGTTGPRGARVHGAAVRTAPDSCGGEDLADSRCGVELPLRVERDVWSSSATACGSRPTSTCRKGGAVPDAPDADPRQPVGGVHRRRAAREPARLGAARLRGRRPGGARALGQRVRVAPFVHEAADGEDCLDWLRAAVRRADRRLRHRVLGEHGALRDGARPARDRGVRGARHGRRHPRRLGLHERRLRARLERLLVVHDPVGVDRAARRRRGDQGGAEVRVRRGDPGGARRRGAPAGLRPPAARALRRRPVPRGWSTPTTTTTGARSTCSPSRSGCVPDADDRRLVRPLPVSHFDLFRALAPPGAAPAGVRPLGAHELRLAVLDQPDGRARAGAGRGLRRRALDAARAGLVRPLAQGRGARCRGGVRYWQLGENEWREAESWPPPHTSARWFLHSAGGANTLDGDGLLSEDGPGEEPADAFLYDPLDPVPTVLGKTLMPTIAPAGIADQTAVERRPDVLCYTSAPRAEPLAVHGSVGVELWASSSAVDTDFTAKLVDIAPDGYAMNLADGIVRARYRESPRRRSEPLRPHEPMCFAIDLWDLAHTFLPGHRLRVEISSSSFPRFDRNPNTGHEIGVDGPGDVLIAEQRVFHDADRPSAVLRRGRLAGGERHRRGALDRASRRPVISRPRRPANCPPPSLRTAVTTPPAVTASPSRAGT